MSKTYPAAYELFVVMFRSLSYFYYKNSLICNVTNLLRLSCFEKKWGKVNESQFEASINALCHPCIDLLQMYLWTMSFWSDEMYWKLLMAKGLKKYVEFCSQHWICFSDSKDPHIDVNYISIRHESVGSISNWHRSEVLCYLAGSLALLMPRHLQTMISSSRPWTKMAADMQTINSIAISWTKTSQSWWNFYAILFCRDQVIVNHHWFTSSCRCQAIIWTNGDPNFRSIYASLVYNEIHFKTIWICGLGHHWFR